MTRKIRKYFKLNKKHQNLWGAAKEVLRNADSSVCVRTQKREKAHVTVTVVHTANWHVSKLLRVKS